MGHGGSGTGTGRLAVAGTRLPAFRAIMRTAGRGISERASGAQKKKPAFPGPPTRQIYVHTKKQICIIYFLKSTV